MEEKISFHSLSKKNMFQQISGMGSHGRSQGEASFDSSALTWLARAHKKREFYRDSKLRIPS